MPGTQAWTLITWIVMNSIKELILEIRTRPSMYIGSNSTTSLKALIDGWYFRDVSSVTDAELMNDFRNWIEAKYSVKGTQSWARILLFYSVDENRA